MSTPHARNIVRQLLKANGPMRIQDIFSKGLTEFPATPFPHPPPPKQYPAKRGGLKAAPPQAPYPGHPFHSHSYLKDRVLPDLAHAREVEKFHSRVEPGSGISLPTKRVTRSKEAIKEGKIDIWQWRLIGRQAERKVLQLEEEPELQSHEWYKPNFGPSADRASSKEPRRNDPHDPPRKNDLYGSSRNDSYNSKRKNDYESYDPPRKKDPYGARQLDHLNRRKAKARPEKQRREKEWARTIAKAREEGRKLADERY